MPETKYYLSQISLPDGKTYDLKDAEARALIAQIEAGILAFIKSTNASNTPEGVTWNDGSTVITGTLPASETTQGKIAIKLKEKIDDGETGINAGKGFYEYK